MRLYAVIGPTAAIYSFTIRRLKRDSIARFMEQRKDAWADWRKKGFRCVRCRLYLEM